MMAVIREHRRGSIGLTDRTAALLLYAGATLGATPKALHLARDNSTVWSSASLRPGGGTQGGWVSGQPVDGCIGRKRTAPACDPADEARGAGADQREHADARQHFRDDEKQVTRQIGNERPGKSHRGAAEQTRTDEPAHARRFNGSCTAHGQQRGKCDTNQATDQESKGNRREDHVRPNAPRELRLQPQAEVYRCTDHDSTDAKERADHPDGAYPSKRNHRQYVVDLGCRAPSTGSDALSLASAAGGHTSCARRALPNTADCTKQRQGTL